MTEELNQVQDETIDFFSNPSEEDTPVETEDTTPVETNVPAEEKPFLEIVYDKETKGLTQDEARELAQKGMNYDRINERYTNLNETLDKLARLNGMDVNTYINSLNETQTEYEIGKEIESLQQKYPNSDEEALRELAESRVKERINLQAQQLESEQKGKDDALQAEVQRQVDLFKREYPDLDPSKLDNEVYEFVKDGYTLTEAYNKWTRIQDEKNRPALEAKEKADRLNEENKKKSFGNITNAGGEEGGDQYDFFKGMDSI